MSKKVVIELAEEDARLVRKALALYAKCLLPENPVQDKCRSLRQVIMEGMKAERAMIEWVHPKTDGDAVFDVPCDEGETVLVRLKSGEYKTDVVCSDVFFGEDDCEHLAYWLDSTQEWDEVDAWAHLPEGETSA